MRARVTRAIDSKIINESQQQIHAKASEIYKMRAKYDQIQLLTKTIRELKAAVKSLQSTLTTVFFARIEMQNIAALTKSTEV